MSDLLETIEDGVAILTLNRPERRNAMSPDMMAGAGPAFCAGGDVKAMAASGEEQTLARIRFNPGRILRQRRSSRIRWA